MLAIFFFGLGPRRARLRNARWGESGIGSWCLLKHRCERSAGSTALDSQRDALRLPFELVDVTFFESGEQRAQFVQIDIHGGGAP